MTAPKPAKPAAKPAPLERLYVTDEELTQIGVPAKFLETFIHLIDRNPKSGFPKPDPMLGNRRYWPAVRDWFEMYNRRGNRHERTGSR